jgi:hypothetical protein
MSIRPSEKRLDSTDTCLDGKYSDLPLKTAASNAEKIFFIPNTIAS